MYPLTYSILQSTGPGPVSYIAGTDYIVTCILESLFKLFFDDVDISQHCYITELNETIRSLNHGIANTVNWSKKAGITINLNKAKATVLGSTQNFRKIKCLDLLLIIIIMDNKVIPFVKSCRNLGVDISSDLMWKNHISKIASKINAALSNFHQAVKIFANKSENIACTTINFSAF